MSIDSVRNALPARLDARQTEGSLMTAPGEGTEGGVNTAKCGVTNIAACAWVELHAEITRLTEFGGKLARAKDDEIARLTAQLRVEQTCSRARQEALASVVKTWGASLDLLQQLVQDVCPQAGPHFKDRDLDREELNNLCAEVETHLYLYRGQA